MLTKFKVIKYVLLAPQHSTCVRIPTRNSSFEKSLRGNLPKYEGKPSVIPDFPKRYNQTHKQVQAVKAERSPVPILEPKSDIRPQEYMERRNKFMELIQQTDTLDCPLNHVVVLPGTGDSSNPVDILFLTGISNATACLILISTQKASKTILFHDPLSSIITQGREVNAQQLKNDFGINEVYPLKTLFSFLQKTLKNERINKLWYDTRTTNYEIRHVMTNISMLPKVTACESPIPYLKKLRLLYSADNTNKINVKQLKTLKDKMTNVSNVKKKSTPTKEVLQKEVAKHHMKLTPDPIPGMRVQEFIERRNKLLDLLKATDISNKLPVNHIVVLPSSGQQTLMGDSNLDMLYMTGITDPQSCLVLLYTQDGKKKSILFHEPFHNITLLGGKISSKYAGGLGLDEILPFQKLFSYLNGIFQIQSGNKLWYDTQNKNMEIRKIMGHLSCLPGVSGYETPMFQLQKMRLVKSEAEVKSIKKTCDVLTDAFNYVMGRSKPGLHLHQLEDMIYRRSEHLANDLSAKNQFTSRKAKDTTNSLKVTKDGDLVIVNAGYMVNGYSTDITRTWPISGKFTIAQRVLYNILYRSQQQLILSMINGSTFDQLYHKMCNNLAKEFFEIKLFCDTNTLEGSIKNVSSIIMPNVGNFVGLETPRDGEWNHVPITEGMVVSLGSGIHIGNKRKDVHVQYRGMEMVLKDIIYIKERSAEILSESCLRSPFELEASIGKSL